MVYNSRSCSMVSFPLGSTLTWFFLQLVLHQICCRIDLCLSVVEHTHTGLSGWIVRSQGDMGQVGHILFWFDSIGKHPTVLIPFILSTVEKN